MTLSAVTRGAVKTPPRILVYGVGGVGKSTFFSESPSPVFVDTQLGTARLNVARFPAPREWQHVLEAVDTLTTSEHEYQTLVFDLLDDIEQLLFAKLCDDSGCSNIADYAGGYGKGYEAAVMEWRKLIARLERLQRVRKMAIGFSAHAITRTLKNPEGEDYDRYTLALHEKSHGLLRGWCDTVLLARHEVVVKTDKRKRTRGISTGARIIHAVETAAFLAKNRDNLPDTLPLDWAEFAAACEAGVPASAEALREEIAELAGKVDDELKAKVEAAVSACGDDSARLVRVLNRLREHAHGSSQEASS
jgi:hypothetical protein